MQLAVPSEWLPSCSCPLSSSTLPFLSHLSASTSACSSSISSVPLVEVEVAAMEGEDEVKGDVIGGSARWFWPPKCPISHYPLCSRCHEDLRLGSVSLSIPMCFLGHISLGRHFERADEVDEVDEEEERSDEVVLLLFVCVEHHNDNEIEGVVVWRVKRPIRRQLSAPLSSFTCGSPLHTRVDQPVAGESDKDAAKTCAHSLQHVDVVDVDWGDEAEQWSDDDVEKVMDSTEEMKKERNNVEQLNAQLESLLLLQSNVQSQSNRSPNPLDSSSVTSYSSSRDAETSHVDAKALALARSIRLRVLKPYWLAFEPDLFQYQKHDFSYENSLLKQYEQQQASYLSANDSLVHKEENIDFALLEEEDEENTRDDVFLSFCETLRAKPQQVLRWQSQGEPLLSSSVPLPHPPYCELCGQERRIEITLLPNLLNELVEMTGQTVTLDFVAVYIFTCHNSRCLPPAEKSYAKEFVHIVR